MSNPYLPFIYLTNFLSADTFQKILIQAKSSEGMSSEQTPHLMNLANVNTLDVQSQIRNIYPRYHQNAGLKIKGGNVLVFSDNRGMDVHQDNVPNKDYPNDPDVGFKPNASAIYYLNDDYEGGEICFTTERPSEPQSSIDNLNLKNLFTLKPQPNSCVFFDASLWHWVRPVTNGKRFSSTFFLLVK